MLIEEVWINKSKNWNIGNSGQYEPFTDDLGMLYRHLQKEYGRCISKIYIDTKDGAKPVGWVFEKKVRYSDCDDTYLQEAWVTLYESKPTVIQNYKFLED
jgi:hypothetical protein